MMIELLTEHGTIYLKADAILLVGPLIENSIPTLNRAEIVVQGMGIVQAYEDVESIMGKIDKLYE